MIDATTGVHLWADRFDGELDDIFDLQDHITAGVVGGITPKLEKAEIERAKRKPTESLDAYDYYLRGLDHFYQRTRDGYKEALRLFYRSIESDSGFAAAHAMAARSTVEIAIASERIFMIQIVALSRPPQPVPFASPRMHPPI